MADSVVKSSHVVVLVCEKSLLRPDFSPKLGVGPRLRSLRRGPIVNRSAGTAWGYPHCDSLYASENAAHPVGQGLTRVGQLAFVGVVPGHDIFRVDMHVILCPHGRGLARDLGVELHAEGGPVRKNLRVLVRACPLARTAGQRDDGVAVVGETVWVEARAIRRGTAPPPPA